MTINKVLSNDVLAQQNQYVQVIPTLRVTAPISGRDCPGVAQTPPGVVEFGPLSALLRPLQRCIDWNRDILKKELGLLEEDIIDLPALFKLDKQGKAVPYFPNTVGGGGGGFQPLAPLQKAAPSARMSPQSYPEKEKSAV